MSYMRKANGCSSFPAAGKPDHMPVECVFRHKLCFQAATILGAFDLGTGQRCFGAGCFAGLQAGAVLGRV